MTKLESLFGLTCVNIKIKMIVIIFSKLNLKVDLEQCLNHE
jgi:hypothetical protein